MSDKYLALAYRVAATVAIAAALWFAFAEFNAIADGTGKWIGEYSPTWFGLTVLAAAVSIFTLAAAAIAIWQPERLRRLKKPFLRWRGKNRIASYLFAALAILLPLWLLARTELGVLFISPASRALLLAGMTLGSGVLISRAPNRWLDFRALVIALILSGSAAAAAAELASVSDYPFSLYWSEGNRLWDYSVRFGRERYLYPADRPIPAYTDSARQTLWGLIFLIPNITIAQYRLWNAFLFIAPHFLLGWALFRTAAPRENPWLPALWAYLFLSQGGIYTPIVLFALLVALTWNRRWWVAAAGVLLASYLSYQARITWLVGPAAWLALLISASGRDELKWQSMGARRKVWIGAAGVIAAAGVIGLLIANWGRISGIIGRQPLLWERLLPNPTYASGILLGVLLATGPLLALTGYIVWKQDPRWPAYKLLLMAGATLGLLAAGLLVSVKIGGGADLHNLDMYLIGLVFLGAALYRHRQARRDQLPAAWPPLVRIALLLTILVPAYQQIYAIAPRIQSTARLEVLAGERAGSLLLPGEEETRSALAVIRQQVDGHRDWGEILFMDQRQLLTFGEIAGIPLVPDYEKKRMIDEAMSANQAYFAAYYRDLAAGRFSLIVTELLQPGETDVEREEFGQEELAWVAWVAEPTLCYYQPLVDLKKFHLQLLVPRSDPAGCEEYLGGLPAPRGAARAPGIYLSKHGKSS